MIDRSKAHVSFLTDIQETYAEQLTISLDDRTSFSEYNKNIKEQWKAEPERINAPPQLRNLAIARIKKTDPTAWIRGFAMQEKKKSALASCFNSMVEACCQLNKPAHSNTHLTSTLPPLATCGLATVGGA